MTRLEQVSKVMLASTTASFKCNSQLGFIFNGIFINLLFVNYNSLMTFSGMCARPSTF